MPLTDGNGIRLPKWAISVIVVVALQTGGLIVTLTSLKNEQRHQSNGMALIRMQLGNISDSISNIGITNERVIMLKSEVDDLENRVRMLERTR